MSQTTPDTPPDIRLRCDNTIVAALITRDDQLCGILRAKPPLVYALPAGHLDGHTPETAARRVIERETGTLVLDLAEVDVRWSGEPCPTRLTGPHGDGHLWHYYRATTSGTLRPDPAEARDAWWMTRRRVQQLVTTTIAYANQQLTCPEFAERPGWEAAQIPALVTAGWATATVDDLIRVERLARTWKPEEATP